MPPTLFLVDSSPVFLTAATSFLAQLPGWQVVGQSLSGEDALTQIEQLHPDLVLLTVELPDASGPEVAARMQIWPNPPMIAFVSLNDYSDYSAYLKLPNGDEPHAVINKANFVGEVLPFLEWASLLRGEQV